MTALLSSCAAAPQAPVLDRFEATLARHASATAALEEWCVATGIANSPDVRALRTAGSALAASAETRAALRVGPDEPLGYRHVRLVCDDTMLSVAHNWYVPARLTPAMNAALETSDAPFGKVVAPLRYTREEHPAHRGGGQDCPAGTVLTKGAVLRLPDGTPISLVIECYAQGILATP
jgi:hypothetical protein